MAVQASPQHLQASVPVDAYAVDAPISRRHYTQQSPAADSYRSAPSPQSTRHPSRRPSGNAQSTDPLTPQQSHHRSPSTSQPSSASTARPLPSPTTHASTAVSGNGVSPSYQHHRREQRNEQDHSAGAPIPPPRTSSNQRGPSSGLAPNTLLADQTAKSSQGNSLEDHNHAPRKTSSFEAQQREEAHLAVLAEYQRANEQNRYRDGSTAGNAATARSRRRGPASPEGPQRSASSRETKKQQLPKDIQSKSSGGVQGPMPSSKLAREDSEVINRVVVTDPVIDLDREKQRLAEAVPVNSPSGTMAATSRSHDGNEEVDDGTRGSSRSRQDHSSSSARRKDNTKFGDYILGQTLGEGEFGKVKLGWKKDGSVQVAIKLLKRENINTNPSRLPKIYREITILRGLAHPNIVRLHEMIETDRHIGIILEYASGGELFDYILNHRYLKDNAARRLFAQLISGVGYLHKKGIVHRDLKLENLLLDRNRNIIITDFGFANTFNPLDELSEEIEYNLGNRDFVKRMDLDRIRNGVRRGDLMQTSCGSPCYAAPELVVTDSLYTGRKVDVWSCGVILYAMLAGYLPFDDDPANPEGDNINLLYKYIVSTPLTFPEYVTPHARDLLRRILVPEPRTRADLFEVARHSWLSDYAHVVSHVTSSTTMVGDITSSTNISHEEKQDAPLLARSASVREPSKPHSVNMSPVGGLSRQGQLDPEQNEKTKPPRDSKRKTVQVEYVAPQSQTTRGELSPSPASDPRKVSPHTPQASARTRSGSQGPSDASRSINAAAVRKPLPQEPSLSQDEKQPLVYQAPLTSNRAQQHPTGSQSAMQPPARPTRDVPRSVSDSAGAFGDLPASSSARPNTGGSMASMTGRLPSRGNSYSLPLAPTVAATNAQGRLAQPKYNISAPIPQPEPYISDPSIRKPSTQQVPLRLSQAHPPREEVRSHKRSSTLTNIFGRSGPIFGGKSSQPQSPQDVVRPQPEKRYPPVSMKAPISSDSPRQSTDSRRPSFSFGRKNSDLGRQDKQEKSRRFSLLPSSFSFKSSNGGSRDQTSDSSRPPSERKRSVTQQYPQQVQRGNAQGLSYGRGSSPNHSEDNLQDHDGPRDHNRQANVPYSTSQGRRDDLPTIRNASQPLQSLPVESSQYTSPPPSGTRPGQSYFISGSGPPTESEVSIVRPQQRRPQYPTGFNSYEEEAPRPPMQQGRAGRGPSVLQKNHRNFTDAYDQDHDPGHHAGSSGAAKRVMDFFRRRGKARSGDDR